MGLSYFLLGASASKKNPPALAKLCDITLGNEFIGCRGLDARRQFIGGGMALESAFKIDDPHLLTATAQPSHPWRCSIGFAAASNCSAVIPCQAG